MPFITDTDQYNTLTDSKYSSVNFSLSYLQMEKINNEMKLKSTIRQNSLNQ